eukprot:2951812-Alexandrium_andersonii.AAC.1
MPIQECALYKRRVTHSVSMNSTRGSMGTAMLEITFLRMVAKALDASLMRLATSRVGPPVAVV